MNRAQVNLSPAESDRGPSRETGWIAVGIVALLVLSYAGSWAVPLLFDDDSTITENQSIRSLWDLGRVFFPPAEVTTAGRPVANFTFAASYALSGLEPWGHHLIGLIVHVLATLTLFGVLRRTFMTFPLRARYGESTVFMAGLIAVLWGAHPVLTQTVTYISQRTESLMALCYLLTLYCFIRGAERRAAAWQAGAVAACALGAMCKEGIVTAPVIVLLYDRAFLADSFSAAWRERKRVYAGLAATWLLVAGLMVDLTRRGVGFDAGVSPFNYALTQSKAVVLYGQLSLWPHPLIFDRGYGLLDTIGAAWPYMLVVAGTLVVVAWAWTRAPRWAFLPTWFLVLLAPTSSVVPVAGAPIAENRLYLPLAGVVTLGVVAMHRVLGWRVTRSAGGVVVLVAIGSTLDRNRDYRSAEAIWADTLAKAPDNYRAQEFFGHWFSRQPGGSERALVHYAAAQRLRPYSVPAHLHLAVLLATLPGRTDDALAHYAAALQLQPDFPDTHYNLALLLATLPGRSADAVAHYETALRLNPTFAAAHNNLANLLVTLPNRQPEAIAHYERALQLKPDYADAHSNLGAILAAWPDRRSDALTHLQTALRLKPDNPATHCALGDFFAATGGRTAEAIVHYERSLTLAPEFGVAHHNLARLLATLPERQGDALEHFQTAVKLVPDNPTFHYSVAVQLERFPGREDEVLIHYARAVALQGDFVAAKAALERVESARQQSRKP